MNEMEKEFFSIKEFAAKVCVHPNTIRRALKSGRLNGFKVGAGKKGTYRIASSEINRVALLDMEEVIEKIIEKRAQNNCKVL